MLICEQSTHTHTHIHMQDVRGAHTYIYTGGTGRVKTGRKRPLRPRFLAKQKYAKDAKQKRCRCQNWHWLRLRQCMLFCLHLSVSVCMYVCGGVRVWTRIYCVNVSLRGWHNFLVGIWQPSALAKQHDSIRGVWTKHTVLYGCRCVCVCGCGCVYRVCAFLQQQPRPGRQPQLPKTIGNNCKQPQKIN